MGHQAHLLYLLWDVGHREAVEPCHSREDIGQDAAIQLEGNLPDDAAILFSACEALDLCGPARASVATAFPLPSPTPSLQPGIPV